MYEDRLATAERAQPGYTENFTALATRLTKVGETTIMPPALPDENLTAILTTGMYYDPTRLEFRSGGTGDVCHDVALLWDQGQSECIIVGYALDDSDVWRAHVWGRRVDGHIIETLSDRRAYYGVELDTLQAQRFLRTYS
jgi:hypothetical protein